MRDGRRPAHTASKEEKASRHIIKHNPEYDVPMPVTQWLHPTQRRNGRVTLPADREVELKNWPNPADEAKTTEAKGCEQRAILIYTDGSKNDQGVGSGVEYSSSRNSQHNFNSGWEPDAPTIKRSNWQLLGHWKR